MPCLRLPCTLLVCSVCNPVYYWPRHWCAKAEHTMRYTSVDHRTGNHVYRHALPDGTRFVRSFKTSDYKVAEQQWSAVDAEYNALAQDQKITKRYVESKDARRERFWNAAARWLISMKTANGGTLPRPSNVELPTETRVTGHPFAFVRKNFLTWAEHNDPDAVKVYRMGDMNQDQLFTTGLVAAYFTLSELERIQPGEVRAQNAPEWAGEPTQGHTLEQVYERWVGETDPAQSTMSDVRRALGLFSEANPEPLLIE